MLHSTTFMRRMTDFNQIIFFFFLQSILYPFYIISNPRINHFYVVLVLVFLLSAFILLSLEGKVLIQTAVDTKASMNPPILPVHAYI